MKDKKIEPESARCGIASALKTIGDRWTLLIVRDAFHGHERFGEFQRSLGVAKNLLSIRLKKLVEDGVFEIKPDAESAASHRYVLTKKGERLYIVLIALWQWGAESCFNTGELKSVMVDKQHEQPLPQLRLIAKSGQALGPRDFSVARPRAGRKSVRAKSASPQLA